jgi:BirA family transcriptional regulator, biotin operon repressor / biotin---[acetyl-CoA-carboxylase] ligase
VSSPYTDLSRPPLRADALNRALVHAGSLWTRVEVYDELDSTNRRVAGYADAGEPEGVVVIAEHQSAGRGRLERSWVSPARAGLTFSVLLRPSPAPDNRWGWLPLLTGLAVADGLADLVSSEVTVKWPNDVLVDGRKLAGVLAERRGDAVIVGIGVNVSTTHDELPVPEATSLALAGADMTDRDTSLRMCLRSLESRYVEWRDASDVDALRSAYVRRCDTLGRSVTVALPDGSQLEGRARDIDPDGRLVVASSDGGDTAIASGDVVHVRPAGSWNDLP